MWWRQRIDRRVLGAWTFEVRGDEIADLALRGRIVLRSIRAVVRDADWNTAPLRVEGVDEIAGGGAGAGGIVLRVLSDGLGSSFTGTVEITAAGGDAVGGHSAGAGGDAVGAGAGGDAVAGAGGDAVTVRTRLVSARAFTTNRTGLVVLHPPALAGRALAVRHPDGSISRAEFPADISPHQPVRDIAALEWRDGAGRVSIEFAGDVFEMEDQRNWTDASFKTYSRPLDLPFPYPVAAGEVVDQAVTVRVRDDGAARAEHGPDASVIARGATIRLRRAGTVPEVAVAASTAPDPAPRVTGLGHATLVELDLDWPGWPSALARAARGRLPLDVRLILPADPTVAAERVRAAVGALAALSAGDVAGAGAVGEAPRWAPGCRIRRITAFESVGGARHVSDARAIALVRAALSATGLRVPVVGGARSHFTELNREHHRLPGDLEGIVFSLTPLFHSRDTEQLVESLAIQRLVAAQAVDIAGGLPVHIGPISLRPHFNDVATTPPPRSRHDDLRDGYGAALDDADDARQAASELGAWTIASAAALAVPGVASLAFFEEWGPRGIRTAAGVDLPAAAAVSALAELSGRRLLAGDSPDGVVWALAAESPNGGATVLAANLDRRARSVTVEVPGLAPMSIDLAPGTWTRI